METWVEIGEAQVSARVKFDPEGLGYEPFQGIHSVIYMGTEIRPALDVEAIDDIVSQCEDYLKQQDELHELSKAEEALGI